MADEAINKRNTEVYRASNMMQYADQYISYVAVYWIPKHYIHHISEFEERHFDLTILQRIFMTLEFPNSSVIADKLSYINASVILLSVISIVISTINLASYSPTSCSDPVCNNDDSLCPNEIICAPVIYPVFSQIDISCVAYFTADFVTRMSLCWIMPTRLSGVISDRWDDEEKALAATEQRKPRPEPFYTPSQIFFRYFFTFFTLVDLVSIVPSYAALIAEGSNSTSGLSALRVLRLLRALRVMRISIRGRMIVELLTRTMATSREAFAILLFYLGLMVIFFASAVYAVESGDYVVNSSYPYGAYVRPNGLGGTAQTPFDSIPTTIYYMIVTFTTVGYGDMAPTTIPGRAIASLCCILGILATALPISIISNNFTLEYQRYLQQKEDYERLRKLKSKRLKELRDVSKQHKRSSHLMNPIQSTLSQSSQNNSESSIRYLENAEDNRIKQTDAVAQIANVRTEEFIPTVIKIEDRTMVDDEYIAQEDSNITKYPLHLMNMSNSDIDVMEVESIRGLFYELRNEYNDLYHKCERLAALSSKFELLSSQFVTEAAIERRKTRRSITGNLE